MQVLLATGNRGKLAELRSMLSSLQVDGAPGFEVCGLDDIADAPEVIEDGETFEANAIKKAVTLARYAGMLTLADDSGLEVDALGGQPGVRSARYAGEDANDAANNAKLLKALEGVPETQRAARFRCVLALADSGGHVLHLSHGRCEGRILETPRGQGGFGYDPLFVPTARAAAGHEGHAGSMAGRTAVGKTTVEKTMAELTPEEKHSISHRGQAMRAMVAYLANL